MFGVIGGFVEKRVIELVERVLCTWIFGFVRVSGYFQKVIRVISQKWVETKATVLRGGPSQMGTALMVN